MIKENSKNQEDILRRMMDSRGQNMPESTRKRKRKLKEVMVKGQQKMEDYRDKYNDIRSINEVKDKDKTKTTSLYMESGKEKETPDKPAGDKRAGDWGGMMIRRQDKDPEGGRSKTRRRIKENRAESRYKTSNINRSNMHFIDTKQQLTLDRWSKKETDKELDKVHQEERMIKEPETGGDKEMSGLKEMKPGVQMPRDTLKPMSKTAGAEWEPITVTAKLDGWSSHLELRAIKGDLLGQVDQQCEEFKGYITLDRTQSCVRIDDNISEQKAISFESTMMMGEETIEDNIV